MIKLFPNWAKLMGMDNSIHILPSNLFFASLVFFIGCGVYLYSFTYMKSKDIHSKWTFYLSLSFFTLAMLGLIFSEHLLLLFLFWEMTSVCSFFLIGLNNTKDQVRKKAKWALYTTVGGGLFLLAGVLILAQIGIENGLSSQLAFSIIELGGINGLGQHELFKTALICILVGVASKSALLPFSFWLPLAMAGPTPVSSFLHSATMVKAGLILSYKLLPIVEGQFIWTQSLVLIGSATALLAALQCLCQRNLKTMLAYSTTCVLGLLAVLLGLNQLSSITTFIVFVLSHALYKATLFQLVGYLDSTYKSMDFFELKKMKIRDPFALVIAMLACLSMIGLPLTLGFYAKEYLYIASLKSGYPLMLTIVFFISNLAMGIQAMTFLRVFWSEKTRVKKIKKNSFLLLSPFIYSLVAFVLACFPNATQLNTYLNYVLSDHLGLSVGLKLKLWHGFEYPYNLVFILSILTIVLSIIGSFYCSHKLERTSKWLNEKNDLSLWGPCQKILKGMLNAFEILTNKLVNGNLRSYLIYTLLGYCFLVTFGFSGVAMFKWPDVELRTLELLTLIISMTGLIAATLTKIHYHILINLALSGFFLVAFFVLHSSVDVSMTQLMIESLSLFFIFFLIKASKIKETLEVKESGNIIIAIFLGLVVASFSFLPTFPFDLTASEFFLANSKELAKGDNVVNVILVDFRALDTFGEVIVVAIAIIGVMTVLTKRKKVK